MKYIFNLINDKDGDRSASYLTKYIAGTDSDNIAKRITRSTFGVNIHNAANLLYYQDKFFNYQFPYLSKYLEDLGIDHSLVYYKYSSTISMKDIFTLDIDKNTRDPSKHWVPDDLNYTGDRARDILNPFNCFYRTFLSISIDNRSDEHKMFLLKCADAFNMGEEFKRVAVQPGLPISMNFDDIQCSFYEFVDTLITLCHRYL